MKPPGQRCDVSVDCDVQLYSFLSFSTPVSNVPVQDFIKRLIGVFITLDPLHEIFYCFLCVTVSVVRAPQLHLLNKENGRGVNGTRTEVHFLLRFNKQTLTTMFSCMTSGSSHTDSTKNTWNMRRKGRTHALCERQVISYLTPPQEFIKSP